MKKSTSQEIALSALSAAMATVFLVVGLYAEVLLFSAYLFSGIALMLPLAKQSYRGYALAFLATCILAFLFAGARFLEIIPFAVFFGLHPLVNELQLKIKINRWVACGIKALWFDGVAYLLWRVVFVVTTGFVFLDDYILFIILVFGSAFFIFYDYATYRGRAMVNTLVARIIKK